MKKALVFGLLASAKVLFADLIEEVEDMKKLPKIEGGGQEKEAKLKSAESDLNDGPKRKPAKENAAKKSKPEATLSPMPASPTKSPAPKNSDKKETRSKAPVQIKSDGKLLYEKNGGLIILDKNVLITQENIRFRSDRAKVWVDEKDPEGSVQKVECEGNVRMNKEASLPEEKVSARAEKARFFSEEQTVILEGDAKLWRGGHLVKGQSIIYDMKDGLITVDKAEGVVQPGDKKKQPIESNKKSK